MSRSNGRQIRSTGTICLVSARAALIALAVPPLQEWVPHKPTCTVIPSPRAFICRSRFAKSPASRTAADIATGLVSIGRRSCHGRDFPRIASPLVGVLGTILRPRSTRPWLGPKVRGSTAPPFMQGSAQRAAALPTRRGRVRRLANGLPSACQPGRKNDNCHSFSHRAPSLRIRRERLSEKVSDPNGTYFICNHFGFQAFGLFCAVWLVGRKAWVGV
jgi:hypothetical protein